MKIDAKSIRSISLGKVSLMGFQVPPEHFPLIDTGNVRSKNEIVERALVLNVVINMAYGMPAEHAKQWLSSNRLESLTASERELLSRIENDEPYDENDIQTQVEALWVLVWVIGFVEELDFSSYCEDRLSELLPSLRESETSEKFVTISSVRPLIEIYQALDLVFCITWGLAEANLTGLDSPGDVRQYVYWERRRALEWIRGGDWDEPNFST